MEEQTSASSLLFPLHTNTIAIPNDHQLRVVHELYKPTTDTIKLKSEINRTVFPEVFIENYNLGTLKDLCVQVLARNYGPDPLPYIADNPLYMDIHYDNINIDLPLKNCYHISSERYWRRVVLADNNNKAIVLKRNYNWRNAGITKKFVKIIEETPAEYWPTQEINHLTYEIRHYVTELHISRLQSLQHYAFDKYLKIRSIDSSSSSISEEDEEEEESSSAISTTESSILSAIDEDVDGDGEDDGENGLVNVEKTTSELESERLWYVEKEAHKRQGQELCETKRKSHEQKSIKRKRREARRLRKLAMEENKKIKKKSKFIKSVFDIDVSDSGLDIDRDLPNVDGMKKELMLKKSYTYPPKHCHHVELSFLHHLINLDTLVLEFLGPHLHRNYHSRHLNFSYQDIEHLIEGIRELPVLRVFRLRNSRMDTKKFDLIVHCLKDIRSLQIVDFGYDYLKDDCAPYFRVLFSGSCCLQQLELESNELGESSMYGLGSALKNYTNGHLIYLGLARNPLTDKALHTIVSAIIASGHLKEFNIRGAKFITENGISCCIAKELLGEKSQLVSLDMSAINISEFAANEILKSLEYNKKSLDFKCRGCNLADDCEFDINVILKRNHFVKDNSYVDNEKITSEEIDAWLSRTQNPILLSVLAKRRKIAECLENRPIEYQISRIMTRDSSSRKMIDKTLLATASIESKLTELSASEESYVDSEPPFVYNPNEFDEQQFMEHVYQSGPNERYYYFKEIRQKNYLRK